MIKLVAGLAAVFFAGSAAIAADAVPPAAPAPNYDAAAAAALKSKNEIVCHSSLETGSLVKRNKVCLTRKQWSYVNDTNHDQAQKLFDDNRTKSGGSN